MPIDITMPALSPTMEVGTLARWMVKPGDPVRSGDILCEIETDKATMEVEAVDEGTVAELLVTEGTDEIPVGQVIARLLAEGEVAGAAAPIAPPPPPSVKPVAEIVAPPPNITAAAGQPGEVVSAATVQSGDRTKASPLARRLAQARGIDLATVTGSGPNGRIVKVDLDQGVRQPDARQDLSASAGAVTADKELPPVASGSTKSSAILPTDIPSEVVKLSNMRKTIARRLTESKQQVPHIYLTVDINLDALLKLRTELNAGLEARGVKLSVNDMLIKALAAALMEVPACNVAFAGDSLIKYSRADISVAVSLPAGLITPVIAGANLKSLSAVSTEMKELAGRAKDGKLQPHEYQGGTASLSNMGMYGIKQFEAVINPPQAMIMAIGAGEKRPYVVNDALAIATVMSATGSFDHRAIDGADGAALMQAFKRLCENPLAMLA